MANPNEIINGPKGRHTRAWYQDYNQAVRQLAGLGVNPPPGADLAALRRLVNQTQAAQAAQAQAAAQAPTKEEWQAANPQGGTMPTPVVPARPPTPAAPAGPPAAANNDGHVGNPAPTGTPLTFPFTTDQLLRLSDPKHKHMKRAFERWKRENAAYLATPSGAAALQGLEHWIHRASGATNPADRQAARHRVNQWASNLNQRNVSYQVDRGLIPNPWDTKADTPTAPPAAAPPAAAPTVAPPVYLPNVDPANFRFPSAEAVRDMTYDPGIGGFLRPNAYQAPVVSPWGQSGQQLKIRNPQLGQYPPQLLSGQAPPDQPGGQSAQQPGLKIRNPQLGQYPPQLLSGQAPPDQPGGVTVPPYLPQ